MTPGYEYYKWWEDENRTILVYNKSEMAQCLEVSLKAIDGWIRKGAPIFKKGSNGKGYQLDVVAFVEWHRARGRGITVEALRESDEHDPFQHLLCFAFSLECENGRLRAELAALKRKARGRANPAV